MGQIQIRVSTDVLAQRANAVEQKIRQVRQKFEKIGQITERSRSYWEGNANEAHRREYKEYIDEIEEALARFQENVSDLRKIGNIYQDAEAESEEISQDLPLDVII